MHGVEWGWGGVGHALNYSRLGNKDRRSGAAWGRFRAEWGRSSEYYWLQG